VEDILVVFIFDYKILFIRWNTFDTILFNDCINCTAFNNFRTSVLVELELETGKLNVIINRIERVGDKWREPLLSYAVSVIDIVGL